MSLRHEENLLEQESGQSLDSQQSGAAPPRSNILEMWNDDPEAVTANL